MPSRSSRGRDRGPRAAQRRRASPGQDTRHDHDAADDLLARIGSPMKIAARTIALRRT